MCFSVRVKTRTPSPEPGKAGVEGGLHLEDAPGRGADTVWAPCCPWQQAPPLQQTCRPTIHQYLQGYGARPTIRRPGSPSSPDRFMAAFTTASDVCTQSRRQA